MLADGTVVVAWRDVQSRTFSGTDWYIHVVFGDDGSSAPTLLDSINSYSGHGYDVDLAVREDGTVWVGWVNDGEVRLYEGTSTGLTLVTTWSADRLRDLEVDPVSGDLIAAWEEGGELWLGWWDGASLEVADAGAALDPVDLLVSASGTPHLAGATDETVETRTYMEGAWSQEELPFRDVRDLRLIETDGTRRLYLRDGDGISVLRW